MKRGTCKHFYGCDKPCGKGHDIREVVGEEDTGWLLRIPCITIAAGNMSGSQRSHWNRRVSCVDYTEPTEAEITEFDADMEAHLKRLAAVKPLIKKIKEDAAEDAMGETKCPVCDNTLRWSISSFNGHVWMKCSTQGCVSVVE